MSLSEGPLSPSTIVSDSSFGTLAWSSPGNAASSDDSKAVSTIISGTANSEYLKATNFGFNIPEYSIIKGILVEIEKQEGSSVIVVDKRIRIVKGGSIKATEKADTGTRWPGSDSYVSHGGAFDLWGETWSPEDINSSGFGAAISADLTQDGSAGQARVDHIRITVYYNKPHPGPRGFIF